MTSHASAERLWLTFSEGLECALDRSRPESETVRHAQAFLELVHRALQSSHGKPISLHMRESLFVHAGIPMADASIRGRATIAFLRFSDAGGLSFQPQLTLPEVIGLLELAKSACEGDATAFGEAGEARIAKLKSVSLLEPNDNVTWDWIDEGPAGAAYQDAGFSLESAAPARREVAEAVEEALGQAQAGTSVHLDVARTITENLVAVGQSGFDNLMQLAERPEFDVFTVQHSLRVSLLATYVASQIGAPREVIIELGAAAMFHDVGKGRIPEEILYKPGRLDDEERRVIMTHPQLGTEILLDSPSVSHCALGAAWGHHLRHDGRGYPSRRPWFETTQATSLIQVCDVFEALTARRPYKAPYSPARAFQILYSDAGAFDPAVLSSFTRAMGLFPPGRFVLLSDGRLGRVSRAGAALDRPTIRVFPMGDVVDLAESQHASLSISRLLEEPEFVQLLMSADAGAAPVETASDEPPSEEEQDTQEEQAARDEEICPHDDEDDDSCRLC